MKLSTRLSRILKENKDAIKTFPLEYQERNKDFYEGVLSGIRLCVYELQRLEK